MENLKSLKHIYYGRCKEDILFWYNDKEIKMKDFLVHFTNMINFVNKNLQNYDLICVKSDSAYFKLIAFYSLFYLEKKCAPYDILDIYNDTNTIIISDIDIDIYKQIDDICDITNIYEQNYNNEKIAIILQSSGTSGKNKIIPLTFKNIISNMNNLNEENIFQENDVSISFFDMYHIYGIYAFILFMPWNRIPFVIFDKMVSSDMYYDNILKYNVTIINTVPCLLPLIKSLKDTKIRYILCSSSSLNSFEHELQEKRLCVPIYQIYGCTECASAMTIQTKTTHIYGEMGKLLNNIEFMIDEGELCVKGDVVYTGNNEWYRTGDIVEYNNDTKTFKYISRKRDMIKYNAKQIIPIEIEEIIKEKLNVTSSLCGIIDKYNEYPALFTTDNLNLTEVHKIVQSYKKPKEIYKVNKFPVTKIGKIKKYLLVQPFTEIDVIFIGTKNSYFLELFKDCSMIFLDTVNTKFDDFYLDKLVFYDCDNLEITNNDNKFMIKTNKLFPFITKNIVIDKSINIICNCDSKNIFFVEL